MADEEHLRILRQGVEKWNQWRYENLNIRPNLSRADLDEADLSGADLDEADLNWANLNVVHFNGASLREAHLRGAHLTAANFMAADLFGANLSGANLRGAVFAGTNLEGTNFSRAEVGRSVFGHVDLSGAKGLESVQHDNPSSIGIETVYRSQGRIPEIFLRGAGVPDEFITYMRSLVGRAIEFYSCFISYSSKDQNFAERLYADLQAKGVRCWFAPEDMKIGDKVWDRLDQSIRLHDKLLLVLSANSIGSEWVEDEVTTAFEEERQRGRAVLFPVRVDDTVFDTQESWAAKVRQRHIGDFRQWKDHDAYTKAFDRLLRDLKNAGNSEG